MHECVHIDCRFIEYIRICRTCAAAAPNYLAIDLILCNHAGRTCTVASMITITTSCTYFLCHPDNFVTVWYYCYSMDLLYSDHAVFYFIYLFIMYRAQNWVYNIVHVNIIKLII